MHLTETFEHDAREISHSRQFVSSALERSGVQATDDVLLVTSEMVTNAVLHGAGQIEVHIDIDAGCVHLAVYDEGGSPPAPRPMPVATARGGRGQIGRASCRERVCRYV